MQLVENSPAMKITFCLIAIYFASSQYVAAQEETVAVNFTFGPVHDIRVRRFPFQNHVLSYYFAPLHIVDALDLCSKTGGRLLTIDRVQTQRAVTRHIFQIIRSLGSDYSRNHPITKGFWVGGIDNFEEGVWRWVNGSRIPTRPIMPGYQNWYRRNGFYEPDDGYYGFNDLEHDCLYVSGASSEIYGRREALGAWFDGNCWTYKYAICESNVEDFDPCAYSLCINRGRCQRISGASFRCICPEGYSGFLCQSSDYSCDRSPCLNGGSCRIASYGFVCDCAKDYHGYICEYYAETFCTAAARAGLGSTTATTPASTTITARPAIQSYWTSWTDFGECDAFCGTGTQVRERFCIGGNPGVDGCRGPSADSRKCNTQSCRFELIWTAWGEFTDCPVTCNGATIIRTRTCVQQYVASARSNSNCAGNASEMRNCNTQSCAKWGNWGELSACTVTCGGGFRTRRRICLNGVVGEGSCIGPSNESISCMTRDCPFWENWSAWGRCSTTCSRGERTKTRNCVNGPPGAIGCLGLFEETTFCNEDMDCPIEILWANWGECSRSCGGGLRTRRRNCGSINVFRECAEALEQISRCNNATCPSWSNWTPWSDCSATCGFGSRSRFRACISFIPNAACPGLNSDSETCISESCAFWEDWSLWSECSATCGNTRRRSRTRRCRNGAPGNEGCLGDPVEGERCNNVPCPRWSVWNNWSTCSASCERGTRSRRRFCINGVIINSGCSGPNEDQEFCAEVSCPLWEDWSLWSECSATCGNTRRRSRTRRCRNGAPGDEGCFGDPVEGERCNNAACPRWSQWNNWSTCSVTCGSGSRNRMRLCINGGINNSGCSGPNEDEEPCSEVECLFWNPWSSWSTCGRSCGGGIQSRTRTCENGVAGQPGCVGSTIHYDICNTERCFELWSAWSLCSVTCGGGIRTREIVCLNGDEPERDCPEARIQREICNSWFCPFWGEWELFGECSATCGRGQRTRERECFKDVDRPLDTCTGDAMQNEICYAQPCPYWVPWSTWSPCSDNCTDGTRIRVRICLNEIPGQRGCLGNETEEEFCNTELCAHWSLWSPWSTCSEECDGGQMSRNRLCINNQAGQGACIGPIRESNSCNTQRCPFWSEWNPWSDCDRVCGGGSQNRSRFCIGGNAGDFGCIGSTEEQRDCAITPCSAWTEWSNYGACSDSCGSGVQFRRRTCVMLQRSVISACPGLGTEARLCNSQSCPP